MNNALTQGLNESGEVEKSCGEDESARGNLTRSKERIEKQLKKVTDALAILDADPKFESNIETILTVMRQ